MSKLIGIAYAAQKGEDRKIDMNIQDGEKNVRNKNREKRKKERKKE